MPKYKYLSKKYKNIRVRTAVMDQGNLYVIGRYNSDGKFRYELAGGKIDKHDRSPKQAAYRETYEEWGRKPIVYETLTTIKSEHLGIETIVKGATWANPRERMKLQKEEGFIKYQKINSSNYHRFRYNYSTRHMIMWLLNNGYMK